MKTTRSILFLFLALFFFSKNLASYAAGVSKQLCYVIDLEEKEPCEKTEKDPMNGKEKSEEWMLNESGPLVQNALLHDAFQHYKERQVHHPYFEISSPPPELSLLS